LSKEEEVTRAPDSSKANATANTANNQAGIASSNSIPTPVRKPSVGVQTKASGTQDAGSFDAAERAKITGSATGADLLETVRQNVGVAVLGNRLDSLLALPPGIDVKRVSTDSDGRATVVVNGHSYRIATIKATIELTNQRKEEVRTILRRRFSGELLQDGSSQALLTKTQTSKITVLTDQQTGINRRQEISWNLGIAPGERKVVSFSYQVLISL
ncbi:MAG: hypothetical protein Q4G59_11280, partial [Planctomycetia bacterium]|nr:hypothetical protein [Planctomycetia bacterium]